eukprot:NODE_290_length_11632_cov_0.441256.p6 type:complete len:174 gc:universal NODE_290_length_11632_cov_0.441256:676-1197(+)
MLSWKRQSVKAISELETPKTTGLLLTIWFSVLIALSFVVMVYYDNFSPFFFLVLNAGYIYSIYQKELSIKKLAFWIHAIVSGAGGILVSALGMAFAWGAKNFYQIVKNNAPVAVPTSSGLSSVPQTASTMATIFLVIFVLYVLYVVFTIGAIIAFWHHCQSSDLSKVKEKVDK